MLQRILSCAALASAVLLLNGCGFVAAPLGYGAAYAGKGTVKAADKGIVYSKKAANVVADGAIYVGETAIYVGNAAADGLKKSSSQNSRNRTRQAQSR